MIISMKTKINFHKIFALGMLLWALPVAGQVRDVHLHHQQQ